MQTEYAKTRVYFAHACIYVWNKPHASDTDKYTFVSLEIRHTHVDACLQIDTHLFHLVLYKQLQVSQ